MAEEEERNCGKLTRNISNSFYSCNCVSNQKRENGRSIESNREGLGPKEVHPFRILNICVVRVIEAIGVGKSCNHVSKKQCNNDIAILHEDTAKDLNDNQKGNDRKSEPDVPIISVKETSLTIRACWEWWGERLTAKLSMSLPAHFCANDSASPVLHSCASQSYADQDDSHTANNGRENLFESARWQDTQKEFEKTTDHCCTQHFTIGNASIFDVLDVIRLTKVGFNLTNGDFKDGQKGEAGSHDRQHSRANEQFASKDAFGEGNRDFENVDDGTDARRNQRC